MVFILSPTKGWTLHSLSGRLSSVVYRIMYPVICPLGYFGGCQWSLTAEALSSSATIVKSLGGEDGDASRVELMTDIDQVDSVFPLTTLTENSYWVAGFRPSIIKVVRFECPNLYLGATDRKFDVYRMTYWRLSVAVVCLPESVHWRTTVEEDKMFALSPTGGKIVVTPSSVSAAKVRNEAYAGCPSPILL